MVKEVRSVLGHKKCNLQQTEKAKHNTKKQKQQSWSKDIMIEVVTESHENIAHTDQIARFVAHKGDSSKLSGWNREKRDLE